MDTLYINQEYLHLELTGRIIAASAEVHRNLGTGFEEVIYQRALAHELPIHDLEFSREVWMDVIYKGEKVGKKRIDFVIGTRGEPFNVLLEIKAKSAIEDVDYIQTRSHLKASGYKIGLLINFGTQLLEIKRLAN